MVGGEILNKLAVAVESMGLFSYWVCSSPLLMAVLASQAMSLAEPGRIICLNMDVDLWGYSTETQRHIIGEGFDLAKEELVTKKKK